MCHEGQAEVCGGSGRGNARRRRLQLRWVMAMCGVPSAYSLGAESASVRSESTLSDLTRGMDAERAFCSAVE